MDAQGLLDEDRREWGCGEACFVFVPGGDRAASGRSPDQKDFIVPDHLLGGISFQGNSY